MFTFTDSQFFQELLFFLTFLYHKNVNEFQAHKNKWMYILNTSISLSSAFYTHALLMLNWIGYIQYMRIASFTRLMDVEPTRDVQGLRIIHDSYSSSALASLRRVSFVIDCGVRTQWRPVTIMLLFGTCSFYYWTISIIKIWTHTRIAFVLSLFDLVSAFVNLSFVAFSLFELLSYRRIDFI